ncbi:hypothetical protein ACJRW5_04200 [Pseudomonas sp. SH1-B]
MMRALKYSLTALGALLACVVLAVAIAMLVTVASRDADATYELRGRYKPSTDGKTYLVIEHDNGGSCGELSVDGKRWSAPLHEAGQTTPGVHRIKCGGEIEIEIRPGTIYYFDYWGP